MMNRYKKRWTEFKLSSSMNPSRANTFKDMYDQDIERAYSYGYDAGRNDIITESQAILDSATNNEDGEFVFLKTEPKKGSYYP